MTYRLEWENPPIEIEGFVVYRKEYDPLIINPVPFSVIFDSRGSGVTVFDSYDDNTAELSLSYDYSVSIIVDGQETGRSVPTRILAPSPTNLARTAKTTTTISISWTNPVGYPVDGFSLAVYNITDDEGVNVPDVSVAPFNSYTITGLTANKTYRISVRFKYQGDYSLQSNEITELTPAADP